VNSCARPLPRRGFTLIDVLTALMLISVFVRIGIPVYRSVVLRAETGRVGSDFEVVKEAVTEYHAEHGEWPEESGPGLVPPGLAPYLDGLPFIRGRYRLDWQHWQLPSGLPGVTAVRAALALSVITEDRALGAALLEALGSSGAHFALGDSYTFILVLD